MPIKINVTPVKVTASTAGLTKSLEGLMGSLSKLPTCLPGISPLPAIATRMTNTERLLGKLSGIIGYGPKEPFLYWYNSTGWCQSYGVNFLIEDCIIEALSGDKQPWEILVEQRGVKFETIFTLAKDTASLTGESLKTAYGFAMGLLLASDSDIKSIVNKTAQKLPLVDGGMDWALIELAEESEGLKINEYDILIE